MTRTILSGIFLLFFVFSMQGRENDLLPVMDYLNKTGIADSIKNDLLRNYISEYRASGKEIALDSLQTRINRLENKEASFPLYSIANRPVVDTSETERLRMKIDRLTEELAQLKSRLENKTTDKPSTATAPSETRQKSIRQEIEKTHWIADSLTDKKIKDGSFDRLPLLYLDSISRFDFEDYFTSPSVGFSSVEPHLLFPKTARKFKGSDAFLFREKLRRRTVNAIAVARPELIDSYGIATFNDHSEGIRKAMNKHETIDMQPFIEPVFNISSDKLKHPTPSRWSSDGKLSVQFSQYYVTKNWYKGGEPNASLLGIFEYAKNYNADNKLIWNNNLDVKIGFFNSGNDTLRAFRVNNDVFKINSRLGYQTFLKKWYYSVNGEFNTSMFTSYAGTNSNEVVTDFLSPTRIFMSLGLDYRYSSDVSVLIAPIAYKLIFLASNKIDPLSVGIANGKSSSSFGYLLQADVNWVFTKEISVNSDFHLFSPYNSNDVEFDWETTGNFTINRYLSTRLSLNMRFDNTSKKAKPDEKNKLQVQEQLSFGFYFKF